MLSLQELLFNVFYLSAFTLAVYYMSQQPFALQFYRRIIYRMLAVTFNPITEMHEFEVNAVKPLWKVLIGCPSCMCSFYGIFFYLFFHWPAFSAEHYCIDMHFLNFIMLNNIHSWFFYSFPFVQIVQHVANIIFIIIPAAGINYIVTRND